MRLLSGNHLISPTSLAFGTTGRALWIAILGIMGTFSMAASGLFAQGDKEGAVIRVGVVGLDTSHAGAFAKIIREASGSNPVARLKIVAAFPGGSPDIPSSIDRLPNYTKEFEGLGVEIVDSVEALLPKVDAVMLNSLDGRTHLSQVQPILKAGKRVFIDKPLAADLTDAIAIAKLEIGRAHV